MCIRDRKTPINKNIAVLDFLYQRRIERGVKEKEHDTRGSAIVYSEEVLLSIVKNEPIVSAKLVLSYDGSMYGVSLSKRNNTLIFSPLMCYYKAKPREPTWIMRKINAIHDIVYKLIPKTYNAYKRDKAWNTLKQSFINELRDHIRKRI